LVIDLGIKMTAILQYLHGLHPPVLHRDFTPDNLILNAHGELTLVDFGAANECASAATGTLIGKQSYMPIEQIRGKAETRSDLYAMGGMMSYLLTGRDPEPLSVARVESVSPALQQLIERLTQMEAANRFLSANEVGEALKNLRSAIGIAPQEKCEHHA
jgi:serine/threonine protein kinase